MRQLLWVVSLTSLAACEASRSPAEIMLADARDRWNARTFPNYSFEMRQDCFCGPEVTQWARIEVVNGVVRRVVLVAGGAEVAENMLPAFPSIEMVFDQIEAGPAAWIAKVEAQYDDALGFPTLVSFVGKPEVADADATYYLRNVAPLP